EGLTVEFHVAAHDWRARPTALRALDGVGFEILRGETLAVVGESGCGKTTLGRTLLSLHRPQAGRIVFDGVDLTSLSGRRLRAFRRRAQMVFQDPYASLDPRMKVEEAIAEPLRAYRIGSRADRRRRVRELLE